MPEYYATKDEKYEKHVEEVKSREIPWNHLNDILQILKFRLNPDIVPTETSRSTSTPSSPLPQPLSPSHPDPDPAPHPLSPPTEKVLLSAKKAMSTTRSKNLRLAMIASGRKIPKNRMPTTSRNKTKRCTPTNSNNEKKYSQTPLITSIMQQKQESNCFATNLSKKLDFINEMEEYDDKRSSMESSMSSHYGWKSRETSLQEIICNDDR